MKSKIDRNDLRFKPEAAKYREQFRMFLDAKDDIAQQTVAAMLYAYHLQGYRGKRINDMFETILSVINMPTIGGNQIEGTNLMEFISTEYGIDFDRVQLQTETETEYLERMLGK